MRQQLVPAIFFSLVLTACTRQNVDLSDRACSNGTCTDGYVCSPVTTMCLLPIAQEPVQPGDACDDAGAVMACAGTTCASAGCRTCTALGVWSACGCPLGDDACQCAIMDCKACVASDDGVEVCNGRDDNCDSLIDNVNDGATGCVQSWPDQDHDGFGAGSPVCFCAPPQNFVTNNTDPDDNDPNTYPDAAELCDGRDNNADGTVPDNEIDKDEDGYVPCAPWVGAASLKGGDCNDSDVGVYPGAPELCDGVANACTGGVIPANEQDTDADGYVACNAWLDRTGMFPGVAGGGDCAPDNAGIHPGAIEIYDGVDDDCDGKTDPCFANCDCPPSIVACWPLDAMPPIDDLSPTNADGTVSGAGMNDHAVTGQIGSAYNFDGSITATVPFNSTIVPGEVTIMAWVKVAGFPAANFTYVIDISNQHRLAIDKDGHVNFASGSASNAVVSTALPMSTWVHLAARRSGGFVTAFVNGLPAATVGDSSLITASGPTCIGSNSDSGACGTSSWIGLIDHLQVFNSGLSNDTICHASGHLTCP